MPLHYFIFLLNCYCYYQQEGNTCAHIAAAKGSLKVMKALVQCDKTTVNTRNKVSGLQNGIDSRILVPKDFKNDRSIETNVKHYIVKAQNKGILELS